MAGNAANNEGWCDKLCDIFCGPDGFCPEEAPDLSDESTRRDWNTSPFDDNDEDGAPLLRPESAVVTAQPQSDFITVVG